MSNPYQPAKLNSGALLQAGIPTRRQVRNTADPQGILLRGVVTATYLIDDPGHPLADSDIHSPTAVYCDVLAYGRVSGVKFIPKALVSQDAGSMHRGRAWKPRAATRDILGNTLSDKTNPWDMDGDHVLVGFMEGNFNQPVILRGIPHPRADVGQEDESAGHRIRLKVADGDPDFWKHRGAFYGISDDGDFVVDLTQAYATELDDVGEQPTPPDDGTTGNYRINLPDNSKLTVAINGAAEVSVAVGEHLATLYTTGGTGMKAAHDLHVHPTGTGPSGVPSVLFPAWNSKIVSDRVKIPDTA